MEWQILYGYFEEAWEDRWMIPVFQLMMGSAILIIGTALNMIIKRTWLEDTPLGHQVDTKEGSLCTGGSHFPR